MKPDNVRSSKAGGAQGDGDNSAPFTPTEERPSINELRLLPPELGCLIMTPETLTRHGLDHLMKACDKKGIPYGRIITKDGKTTLSLQFPCSQRMYKKHFSGISERIDPLGFSIRNGKSRIINQESAEGKRVPVLAVSVELEQTVFGITPHALSTILDKNPSFIAAVGLAHAVVARLSPAVFNRYSAIGKHVDQTQSLVTLDAFDFVLRMQNEVKVNQARSSRLRSPIII